MGGKETVRIGVIGTGGMGERHAVNLYRFAGSAKVTALYDLDEARARKVGELCGDPVIFQDPEALIRSDSVDAIVVASPDSFHARFVLACLKAEKPILCEKPLASEIPDALRIIEAETKLGRKLVSVGFNRRFDPYHLEVRKMARSGEIGSPLLWKGTHRNASAMYDNSGAFILVNSAGHDVDSARWLLESEVRDIYVRGLRSRPNLADDARDLLAIQMTMANGRLATAEVFVNADYGYEVNVELVCDHGTVVTDHPEKAVVRQKNGRGVRLTSDFRAYFHESYTAEIIDWVDSLGSGRTFSGASAWDGYAALAVTAAACESLREETIVSVKMIAKPSLYAGSV
jgi:myo-inositol 2-dehydrogenase / D-chiro-inositol 1-dehydrogenase